MRDTIRQGIIRIPGVTWRWLGMSGALFGAFHLGLADAVHLEEISDASGLWWVQPVFGAAVFGFLSGVWRRRDTLRSESLITLREISYADFRLLIAEAMRREGYEIEERSGLGVDHGVDLLLRKEGWTVAVSCLHWGSEEIDAFQVQDLYTAMLLLKADAAMYVTTGKFTADAHRSILRKPVVLADGKALLDLVQPVQADPAYETACYLRKASLEPAYKS